MKNDVGTSAARDYLAAHLADRMNITPHLDTQVKVCKAAGIAQASVQRILARQQSATIDVIWKLAEAFGDDRGSDFLLSARERKLLRSFRALKPDQHAQALAMLQALAAVNTGDLDT